MKFVEVSTLNGVHRVKKPEDWIGYTRSEFAVDKQRRYKACCKNCGQKFMGTNANLILHKSKCPHPQTRRSTGNLGKTFTRKPFTNPGSRNDPLNKTFQ